MGLEGKGQKEVSAEEAEQEVQVAPGDTCNSLTSWTLCHFLLSVGFPWQHLPTAAQGIPAPLFA